ncbi:peptidase PmbA [Candidatus Izimaplasma bacterium HR1]|jgi:PmbA protein|uniref:metallopeptidase TldD-related protein n=1 Tax=Candidatus Izimoplasma sp. HR1 TaxID=1541959 RepID=UPI0004F92496|nr:peptidase PmbA [Candidatus Izimaplasma bacterium HR1]
MKKEYITTIRKEISIKLQASEINSLRVKDIERNAVRVYKDGYIGISGAIGSTSKEELTNQAIENLASKIPYPHKLEENRKDHRNLTDKIYNEQELMGLAENFLSEIKEENDDFIYSESFKAIKSDISLSNSEGLDLRYQDQRLDIGIIVKAKSSPNLFDTFLGWSGRNMDFPRFIETSKMQLTAERTKVDLPEGEKLPVFFADLGTVGGFITSHLSGETYGNGASFFKDKIGKKIFNEKVNMFQNRDPKITHSRHFDMEGVCMENDRVSLIENGVLKRVFTDKKTAKKFNYEHTGSAAGGYDDVPTISSIHLRIENDSTNIVKALEGKMAIVVVAAAGGEVNADGNYATPVQSAYLFDGEKFVGKLPEFSMENHIYNILGEDYIGTFEDPMYHGENDQLVGCYMKITK